MKVTVTMSSGREMTRKPVDIDSAVEVSELLIAVKRCLSLGGAAVITDASSATESINGVKVGRFEIDAYVDDDGHLRITACEPGREMEDALARCIGIRVDSDLTVEEVECEG